MKKTILLALLSSAFMAKQSFAQKLYSMSHEDMFHFNPDDNSITRMGSFTAVNMALPWGKLLHVGNGVIYGVTGAAPGGYGGVFKTDTINNTITLLYPFTNNDRSVSGFELADNGKLYTLGLTATSNSNAIYSFDMSTNAYTQVYEIPGNSGGAPYAALFKASNGLLYGTTQLAGANNGGRLFSFDPSSNTFTTLHDFNSTDGKEPVATLMQASNGKLYGTTSYGGTNDHGVLFSYDISSNTYTKLFDFDQATGESPATQLMQASNGLLYGTTMTGGSYYQGTLYSFDISSNTYTQLHAFFASDGYGPRVPPVQASNGLLYGTTNQGGANYKGSIYSFDITSSTYTKIIDGTDSMGGWVAPFLSFATGSSVGLSQVDDQTLDVQVFPNPCKDQLTVHATGELHYQIINTLGQVLETGTVNNNIVLTNHLQKGMYFLLLKDTASGKASRVFLKE